LAQSHYQFHDDGAVLLKAYLPNDVLLNNDCKFNGDSHFHLRKQ